mmetsp:Transcript_40589/g.74135  ORF Transcript_40589/g.74135 Transcript_40589/m.74135 type:complete len:89 (-) Transcript_40589:80-346(-)
MISCARHPTCNQLQLQGGRATAGKKWPNRPQNASRHLLESERTACQRGTAEGWQTDEMLQLVVLKSARQAAFCEFTSPCRRSLTGANL